MTIAGRIKQRMTLQEYMAEVQCARDAATLAERERCLRIIDEWHGNGWLAGELRQMLLMKIRSGA